MRQVSMRPATASSFRISTGSRCSAGVVMAKSSTRSQPAGHEPRDAPNRGTTDRTKALAASALLDMTATI